MVKLSKPITHFPNLAHPLSLLPPNYNFELKKVLSTIARHNVQKVGLQLPDGLLKYSTILSDAIEGNTTARVVTLADVVYGACCVDTDADVELIVHYGHSCIVGCGVKVLYVFVDVFFESEHLEGMVGRMIEEMGEEKGEERGEERGEEGGNEKGEEKGEEKVEVKGEMKGEEKGEERGEERGEENGKKMMGEVNGKKMMSEVNGKKMMGEVNGKKMMSEVNGRYGNKEKGGNSNSTTSTILSTPTTCNKSITVLGTVQYRHIVYKLNKMFNLPTYQVKPLSTGEVLGCTSPKVHTPNVVFISDGRFHLESLMIANPTVRFFRYCPFNKRMYREHYDHTRMHRVRAQQRCAFMRSRTVGIINGTLGAQGNSRIVDNVHDALVRMGKEVYVFNMEEVKESNLRFPFVEGYVQVCCPRLSIDWGHLYGTFMLCAYEVFNERIKEMDFYSKEEIRPWNNH